MIVESAFQPHGGIGGAPVFPEIATIPLSPNTDGLPLRQGQSGEIVVAAPLIPKAVALIKDILVHSEILHSFIRFG